MTQRDIISGPGKFDLMASLFVKDHNVFFTLNSGEKVTVNLTSVGIEDGSRESWLIEGHLIPENGSWIKFTGWYATSSAWKGNKGYIKC